MKLIKILKNLNKLFPKPPADTDEMKKERERRIVSRYGWDQISLSKGRYLTPQDIATKKDRLRGYCFIEGRHFS